MKRSTSAVANPSLTTSPPFAAAPTIAATAKYQREGSTSARLSTAAIAVPQTKPSCTMVVNHAASPRVKDQDSESCGETELAANQSDIPSSSAPASNASIRQRAGSRSSGGPISGDDVTRPRASL